MATHNIENLRAVIKDYPKLWEWEAVFDKLPVDVASIINTNILTVLMDKTTLPTISVGDTVAKYKGAQTHYGTRMVLTGDINLTIKEVKGDTPEASWLVRRGMKKWIELVDNFFGDVKALSIADYKTTLTLSMQNEIGDNFYKTRFFGIRPVKLNETKLTYDLPGEKAEYPTIIVGFTYDFWKDQYDPDFGPG